MTEIEQKKDDPPTQKLDTPTQQSNDENRMSTGSGAGSTRPSLYLEASFASISKSLTKSNTKTSANTSLTKKRSERLRSMTTDSTAAVGGENVFSSSSVTSTRKSESNSSMAILFGDKTNNLRTANNCSLVKENGFQRGLKPEKIIELEEKDGERKFFIKWSGSHPSEYGIT